MMHGPMNVKLCGTFHNRKNKAFIFASEAIKFIHK